MKMRTSILLILCLLAAAVRSQTVANLDFVQLPKYGYTLSRSDTSIVEGQSLTLGKNLTVYGGTGSYVYSWIPSKLVENPSSAVTVATPVGSTIFYQKVTDGNGCVLNVSYNVTVTSKVNIPDQASAVDLTVAVSPNPVKNVASVSIKGQSANSKLYISVVDNLGKTIKKKTLNNFSGSQKIDIDLNVSEGIYNMVVEIDNQKVTTQFKVE